MQEVSGTFLSRADPKDDVSCAPCLPAANKFLGSDCKELHCLVQTAASKVLSSADERKKASTAYEVFQGCAKENKCNLYAAAAAAEVLHIIFDDLASLLQVDDDISEEDSDEDIDASNDESEESEAKEAAMQLAGTDQGLVEESEDSENEEAVDGSFRVSDSDSKGEAIREAIENGHISSYDVQCAQCLAPANNFFRSDCKDFVCLVKAYAAQKKVLDASEAESKKAGAVGETLFSCAKENKCELQSAISAAAELGMDLSVPESF